MYAVLRRNSGPILDSTVAFVAEALPKLLSLTQLKLGGNICREQVLAATSSLPHLQRVNVAETGDAGNPERSCPGSSYAALPVTMTALVVNETVNPDIKHLTALQELHVCNGGFESFSLARFRSLRRLTVGSQFDLTPLIESRLAQFVHLSNLEHLDLRTGITMPWRMRMNAPFAACSRLTYLSIGHMLWVPEGLFTSDRQLTRLAELHLTVELLSKATVTQQMVEGCPNVQKLVLYDHRGWQRDASKAATYSNNLHVRLQGRF